MACLHPMIGYRSKTPNENGRYPILFTPNGAYSDMRYRIPCGKCVGCRLEYSRQWAIRCIHEAKMHDEKCFITLTYSDDKLPEDYNLRPKDMVDFIKRLRKSLTDRKIRYFQCGEYGETTYRPHHHMILYGHEFKDLKLLSKNRGNPLFESAELESIWQNGFCSIGEVNFQTAAYVARYVLKKSLNPDVDSDFVEPYVTMSRRPGIGMPYYEKYGKDVYNTDSVVVRGREMRPPKFYDTKFYESDPERMEQLKKIRRSKAKVLSAREEEMREACLLARGKQMKRSQI